MALGWALTFLRFDFRQVQQIAHQAHHTFRFGLHDGQKAVTGSGVFAGRAAQRFNKPQNRGERRAQFMADIGHKIAAHRVHLFAVRQVFKGAKHRLPNGGCGDAVDHLVAGAGNNMAGFGQLTAPCGGRDGRQNLGLAQHESMVAPHQTRTQKRQGRSIAPRNTLIRADHQGGQGQAGQHLVQHLLIHARPPLSQGFPLCIPLCTLTPPSDVLVTGLSRQV